MLLANTFQIGCGPSRVRGARYEAFVKDTNKSIEEATRSITNKTEEKATAEADKTAAEEDKNSAMNEQQQNQNENADLHKACDFTLNNFEVRRAANLICSFGTICTRSLACRHLRDQVVENIPALI